MIPHRIINNTFGNPGLVCQKHNPLGFVVLGFLFIRHRVPFIVPANLPHFVTGLWWADDFTADGGFFEEGIGRHPTARGIATLVVIGPVEPPFGALVNNIRINDSAGFISTGEKAFIGDEECISTTFAFFPFAG